MSQKRTKVKENTKRSEIVQESQLSFTYINEFRSIGFMSCNKILTSCCHIQVQSLSRFNNSRLLSFKCPQQECGVKITSEEELINNLLMKNPMNQLKNLCLRIQQNFEELYFRYFPQKCSNGKVIKFILNVKATFLFVFFVYYHFVLIAKLLVMNFKIQSFILRDAIKVNIFIFTYKVDAYLQVQHQLKKNLCFTQMTQVKKQIFKLIINNGMNLQQTSIQFKN